ncbi:MAG: phosphoribosylglycinamide formyltransferase [Chitinophagaceae bacterium]|nr:phosphoribosylglycinamide formyltransferase [Chitinophagaceae bacterium]MCW5906185.1 phosphoribosylglycinamide formyltransferase [Chitinophagaceae bacterium]
MQQIAIFASGAGSNAAKIIDYFISAKKQITVSLIVCNNPNAGVLKIAASYNIATLLIDKEPFFKGDAYLPQLQEMNIDFIVLAGFLWKIPEKIITAYTNRMINIHPALLPKYGGKGMYGDKVHTAVLNNKETQSGITIHFVNKHYDEGEIIFQATCPVDKNDTPETLAKKIHALEHKHYSAIIDTILSQ